MKKPKVYQKKKAYRYWKTFPSTSPYKIAEMYGIAYSTLTKFITKQLSKKVLHLSHVTYHAEM